MLATKERIIAQREIATERYVLSTKPHVYLPLYKCDGTLFISKDAHGHVVTKVGTLPTINGDLLDGTDDIISVPLALDDYSDWWVDIWVKPVTSVANKGLWGQSSAFSLYYRDPADYIRLWWNINIMVSPTGLVVNGKWIRVGVGRQGSAWEMDIDGKVKIATGTNVNTTALTTLHFGGRGNAAWGNWLYGEAVVYTKMPTHRERSEYYEATRWRYQ